MNEAGITVAFHAGESGYGEYASHWGEAEDLEAFGGGPFRSVTQTDRAIYDAMAALIVHGVFQRFPNLRVCSIENGSDWVAGLLRKLKKAERMNVRAFREPPVDVFRRHVSVAPYYEEDVSRARRRDRRRERAARLGLPARRGARRSALVPRRAGGLRARRRPPA